MVMNIRVLTPDRVICSTTADEVVLPGLTGQVGLLDGHAALITPDSFISSYKSLPSRVLSPTPPKTDTPP